MTRIPEELKSEEWFRSEVYTNIVNVKELDEYIVYLEYLSESDFYGIRVYKIYGNDLNLEFYDDAVSWSDALDKFNTWYKKMKEDTK